MILGFEVAFLVMGLYALIAGRLPMSKKGPYVVVGAPARAIGVIGLLPLPLSFVAALAIVVVLGLTGRRLDEDALYWVSAAVEAMIVLACGLTMSVLYRMYRRPVHPINEEHLKVD